MQDLVTGRFARGSTDVDDIAGAETFTRHGDRPGFLEPSGAHLVRSHEPVSPSTWSNPLCQGMLCARLGGRNTAGSGRAAEGRRLDAESRAETPLRDLPDPRETAIQCRSICFEKAGGLQELRAVSPFLSRNI